MRAVVIAEDADEADFRAIARRCIAANIAPRELIFTAPEEATLLPPPPDFNADAPAMTVPRAYGELLADAICHRHPDRFALLYDVLWRVTHGEKEIMGRASDPAIARLSEYARNVRRDIHKMHAFVRFRSQLIDGSEFYAAWFEPQHYVLRRAVPFFVDRFTNMNWLIATQIGVARWHDGTLSFGPPVLKPPAAEDAVLDELWLTYYRTTFNPARVRLKAMTAEMPVHYWNNMPETALIPDMVAGAQARVSDMASRDVDMPPRFAGKIVVRGDLADTLPRTPLADLREEARQCTRCPLYKNATQTVFGEGRAGARLVFVGEQPGDREDIEGKPFVGPAGNLFDRALEEAGIDRNDAYVTNAVKHFKYEPRGKRRLHKRPNAGEVKTCKWWLDRELAAIKPDVVVALGATAAQSLAGRAVSVLNARGPTDFHGQPGFVTVHPSFLLRIPEAERKAQEYENFVADLRQVKKLMEKEKAA